MPGSWEMTKSTLVGILHVDTTTVNWALGLRKLQIPGPDPVVVSGMPFDHARNHLVEIMLGAGLEWMFMLDSDVVCPPDTILRLQAHKQPIISGIYCRRSPPEGLPVMQRGGSWVVDYPPNSVIEVDVVGSGCLLIHRSVFEKLPPQRPGKRWFDWRVDMREHMPIHECLSEDFTFCSHARKNGYRILVDTSIMCKHIGYAEAKLRSFKPLESWAVG